MICSEVHSMAEAKPLPYMLAQMNLLLHGLEAPQIAYGNTLDRRINEIGHSERVDVILTNPPFGGEEEVGIKANFPPNMQTSETALLFYNILCVNFVWLDLVLNVVGVLLLSYQMEPFLVMVYAMSLKKKCLKSFVCIQ